MEPMETVETVSDFDGLRFVIARYNEDIEWVPPLMDRFPGARCTVYNKGHTEIPESNAYDIRTLENVGRESHTYLHHVTEIYDSEDDTRDEIIVFLQGHPFDHCKGVNLYQSIMNGVIKIMEGSGFENIGSQIIKIVDGEPTFHMTIREELAETSSELFERTLPKEFTFSAGALFVTSRYSIERRPIGFYQKAMAMLDSEINPVRGFCFERLWSLIFV